MKKQNDMEVNLMILTMMHSEGQGNSAGHDKIKLYTMNTWKGMDAGCMWILD